MLKELDEEPGTSRLVLGEDASRMLLGENYSKTQLDAALYRDGVNEGCVIAIKGTKGGE